MKRLLFNILLVIFVLISCNKDEETPERLPRWMQEKIEEVISVSSMDVCEICDVTITEYAGKKYYNFYCGHWSCLYCYFFDEDGNAPQWEAADWEAYEAGKKVVAVVSPCD